MGWKDGCPDCGGHRNGLGALLHKPNCVGVIVESTIPVREFQEGVIRNLAVLELKSQIDQPDWIHVHQDMAKDAVLKVVSRFPGSATFSMEQVTKIIDLVWEELKNAF